MKKTRILSILIMVILFSFLLRGEDANLEERFQQARTLKKGDEFIKALMSLYQEFPSSYYGQLALLELAQIDILQRDYGEAIKKLRTIYHNEINTKEYWLANAYYKNGQYQEAIISAQNYIFNARDKAKIEYSYFIIIESYIGQKLFTRALNTLDFLRNSEFIENNIPLLHYRSGYCHEMLGNYEQALNSYRKLKMEFPYHSYSYQAEDRMYALSREKDNSVTSEELQEFRNLDPEKIDVTVNEDINLPDPDTPVIPGEDDTYLPDDIETEPVTSLKIYLQVGAFSNPENAAKLAAEIDLILSYDHIIFTKELKGRALHVVAYGPFSSEKELIAVKQMLKEEGYNSFVIKRY
ncbi:MAG: SPOR domain-containing protein [Candidatus Cloacimonetes bacterium]|nr:SPOR domain-containing protein [Candidatus Cloacimonadota bacterium]